MFLFSRTVYCLALLQSKAVEVVCSENSVTLRVASAQAEADTNPHRESSSSEEKNGSQNTATETHGGFDQSVGQDKVPLVVE